MESFKTFYVCALGCPKNLSDSEFIVREVEKAGIKFVKDQEKADLIIVNTCAFIKPAIYETVEFVNKFIEMDKKIIVTGCLPLRVKPEIIRHENIIGVLRTTEFGHFGEFLKGMKFPRGKRFYLDFNPVEKPHFTPPHYRYVKIADGCNHRCAFCTIPQIKGRYRSKPMELILKEIKSFPEDVKEVILVSQDSTKYGVDLYGKRMLHKLLLEIKKIFSGWIRVLYLYPIGIYDDLLRVITEEEGVTNYLDIPFQHVSDRVLKSMNRGYGGREVRRIIEKVRKHQDVSIRGTFIYGSPFERKREFYELENFLEEYRIERSVFFPYSKEEGTRLFSAKEIPSKEKSIRGLELQKIATKISYEKNQELIGREMVILVDGEEEGEFYGRTEYDTPDIDNIVWLGWKAKPGCFVKGVVTDAIDFELFVDRVQEGGNKSRKGDCKERNSIEG